MVTGSRERTPSVHASFLNQVTNGQTLQTMRRLKRLQTLYRLSNFVGPVRVKRKQLGDRVIVPCNDESLSSPHALEQVG